LRAGTRSWILLIDVRMEESYRAGHLPGAINIPSYQFDKDTVPGLPADRSSFLVAYCGGEHCGLGSYAAERLLDLGYQHVFVYEEGPKGWIEQGQKLVTKKHENLPRIGPDDLGALLATGRALQLVDARAAAEFARQTAPQARNVPPENCRPGAAGLPPDQGDLVVVFGQSRWDGRPAIVAEKLLALGYKDVKLFTPGLNGWPKRLGDKN